MDAYVRAILNQMTRFPAATAAQVVEAEQLLGKRLPDDYREVLLFTDGAQGAVAAEGRHLILYPVEQIHKYNQLAGFSEFAPHLVSIGSDGGGGAFSVDYSVQPPRFVRSELVTLDDVEPVASTFAELLRRLACRMP